MFFIYNGHTLLTFGLYIGLRMNFTNYKRIVIKIGSSTITDSRGKVNTSWLKALAKDIRLAKKEFIIVTSGAVALGKSHIKGKLSLEQKQAASAIGQIKLMEGYKAALKPMVAAQVLLTFNDTERRSSYLNAKNSIEILLENNVVPIINENDLVATQELRYGDNDRLSARVAQMMGADLLIILSDIDGLYTANPFADKSAKHLELVTEITPEIEKMAGGAGSSVGTGGMITKIEAAKIATRAGCDTIITSGALAKLFAGKSRYTLFKAATSVLNARKSWIVSGVKPMGEIYVDDGAEGALLKGKSLLPAGVTDVFGDFEEGDLVIIRSKEKELARGLASYSAADARKIMRKKTAEIEQILGYIGRSELVHRDDMVMTTNPH